MYHGVEAKPLSPSCWHVIGTAQLRRELAYVARHFTVMPLEEALERLLKHTLPDRVAVVTFDDGARNFATHAAPVLREFNMPAAVFLATRFLGTGETLWPDRLWLALAHTNATRVDLGVLGLGAFTLQSASDRGLAYTAAVGRLKDLPDEDRVRGVEAITTALSPYDSHDPGPFRLLTWDEVRDLMRDGLFSFFPHSATHPILSRCPDQEVEQEISESCAAIERELGQAARVFAYPNGRMQDFDDRARTVLERIGVRWALATIPGFASADSDPLALPRIAIGSDLSFAQFRLLVSGAPRVGG
jgi:peptidoglycan/xylan/chitin deacetylase (PgdA/CDA1 family)